MSVYTYACIEVLNDVHPAEMQELADDMSTAERERLSGELTAMAVSAAWKAAYLERRYGSGCSDQGHASAVKAANKACIAVRRAMGFSYPDRGTINV